MHWESGKNFKEHFAYPVHVAFWKSQCSDTFYEHLYQATCSFSFV